MSSAHCTLCPARMTGEATSLENISGFLVPRASVCTSLSLLPCPVSCVAACIHQPCEGKWRGGEVITMENASSPLVWGIELCYSSACLTCFSQGM